MEIQNIQTYIVVKGKFLYMALCTLQMKVTCKLSSHAFGRLKLNFMANTSKKKNYS